MINYGGLILGIVLSIIFFIKGKESKDPRCFYRTYKNIFKLTEKDSKIKLFYENKEVNRVFTTDVWLWNKGKKPVQKPDIPTQAKLKLSLYDKSNMPEILDFVVIR